MSEEKMVVKIRYARTVIMETTVEIPVSDFGDDEYVGPHLDDGRLPDVYANCRWEQAPQKDRVTVRGDHVDIIVDDDTIYEVTRA